MVNVNSDNLESDIKSWLVPLFPNVNFEDFYVRIVGNSEKGDGYLGDIVFIQAITKTNNKDEEHNLVLKCSKNSKQLREQSPIRNVFLNEIYVYDAVFPALNHFERARGINDVFSSIAKYYGTFVGDDKEVIVFENLKKSGYDLWNKKEPLDRQHLELVMGEYAKFHAASAALQDQKPDEFYTLTSGFKTVFSEFLKIDDIHAFYRDSIDEVVNVLKDDVDDAVVQKFSKLKDQTMTILGQSTDDVDGLKVIVHGDCWNNNFLYKHAVNTMDVAILDWQISRISSPIYDLSYFLFACIGQNDIDDLYNILIFYHKAFSARLELLGSDPQIIYPLHQFLDEWKKYAKFGVLLSTAILKVVSTEKDEVIDIAQAAEEGKTMMDSFRYDVRDKETYKQRIRPIVKYAVQHDLV